MKLPIAIATLFLAATTALPAFARAPTGHTFFQRDAARVESVQHGYRNGYAAYAAAPGVRRPASGWGHCVSGGASELQSAYPSWDVC